MPQAPPIKPLLKSEAFLRIFEDHLIWYKNQVIGVRVHGEDVIGGRYIQQATLDLFQQAFQKLFGESVEEYIGHLAGYVEQEAVLSRIEVDTGGTEQALLLFTTNLETAVDQEVDKIFAELLATGERLLNSDHKEAGRWWKKEHGNRAGDRETGKLFGDKNVVKGKKTADGFLWPDPVSLKRAKHWRRVEYGDQKPHPMPQGRIAPRSSFTRQSGTPTNSKFIPSRTTRNKQRKSVPKNALWVGTRQKFGAGGEREPTMSQNTPKFLLGHTAAEVFGENGDKLVPKFEIVASKLLADLEKHSISGSKFFQG